MSERNKGGRPSSYKPEFAAQAAKLCSLGATDQEMADFFEVNVLTIYRWKHAHDEFCKALKVGKEVADERVERSLYQRAIGYEQDEVKIFMPGGAAEPVYAPFRAKIAPDVTAAIFWLKNRRRELWRDVTEHHSKVKHEYDFSGVGDNDLAELERIVGAARSAESDSGGEGAAAPSKLH
jgi:hypothetical protein